MQDIAERTGVSISTVSRVFTNRSIVDENIAEMVLKVADELNYVHKSQHKEMLNKGYPANHGSIVFMIPNMQNPHCNELVDLIGKVIQKMGYSMILSITENNIELMEKHFKMIMTTQKVIGCIMASVAVDVNAKWYCKVKESLPVVAIQVDDPEVDTISTTDEEGTFEMVEYLIEQGHREIAFVGYSWNIPTFGRRLSAYKDALKKHNIPIKEDFVCQCKADLRSGYDYTCKLLTMEKRPTAIHCFNTYTAIGVYSAITDYKLNIPDDISLSAFDEALITSVFLPKLSVVAQPLDSISETAVEMILKRREMGMTYPRQSIKFPTNLLIRKSIGKVPEKV